MVISTSAQIFAEEWVCPGLAAEIPNPGDYTTFTIGAQPIFTVRGRDGRIRSFSNVCRHRMMILLEGQGNAQRVVDIHLLVKKIAHRFVAPRPAETAEGHAADRTGLLVEIDDRSGK